MGSSDGKKRDWFDEEEEDSSSSEEEEEDNGDLEELWRQSANFLLATASMVIASNLYLSAQETERLPMYTRNRVLWHEHVHGLLQERGDSFRGMYRMSLQSFNKLCDLVRPIVKLDEAMSVRRTGKAPIITEMMVHCLIRFLSGASPVDARLTVGISIPSFYRILYRCVHAILRVPELEYHFPATDIEISEATTAFNSVSNQRVVDGCVACLDGMLLRINTPKEAETANAPAYFSGHYQDYGINVQAACDSRCRFVYAALAAPGGAANDIFAYRQCTLEKEIENLPIGKYVIGDNAYVCTEHLLTPFPGDAKKKVFNDSYNFHISQCRIRIEMTFGRFTNKWRLFRRPLEVKLENIGPLFLCATRLHNFCINQKILEEGETLLVACHTDGQPGNVLQYVPASLEVTAVRGNSMLRDYLVKKLERNNIRRPVYNCVRNKDIL